MTAVWTVEAVCTSVLLEPCLCRRHVLHAVGAVVAVHLVGDTETTSANRNIVLGKTVGQVTIYLMSRQCLQKYNLQMGLREPQLHLYLTRLRTELSKGEDTGGGAISVMLHKYDSLILILEHHVPSPWAVRVAATAAAPTRDHPPAHTVPTKPIW